MHDFGDIACRMVEFPHFFGQLQIALNLDVSVASPASLGVETAISLLVTDIVTIYRAPGVAIVVPLAAGPAVSGLDPQDFTRIKGPARVPFLAVQGNCQFSGIPGLESEFARLSAPYCVTRGGVICFEFGSSHERPRFQYALASGIELTVCGRVPRGEQIPVSISMCYAAAVFPVDNRARVCRWKNCDLPVTRKQT